MPEVSPHMSTIPLYTEDGHIACMRSPESVKRLLDLDRITVIRDRKGNIRRGFFRRCDGSSALRPTIYVGTKYSFNQRVGERGKIWDLKKLAPSNDSWEYAPEDIRPMFLTVLRECLSS